MWRKHTYLYFLLQVFLFVAQAIFTLNSMNQIRYEELANAVRNPFWLSQRLVYDGLSTSVGWDGIMLIIYNIFGFSLFAGKFFRLFLSLVSFFCLSKVLNKYLGEKHAWLPLLVIGLSPTLLFYTTLQAQYAIDLQFLPITIYLLTSQVGPVRLIGAALAMLAWLSYPSFIFYLPALVWIYIKNCKGIKEVLLAILAFIIPFAVALFYIQNKEIFLNDPNTNSGVFRGAGSSIGFDNLSSHLSFLIRDFFDKGSSYHFDVFTADFSLFFPIATFLSVMTASVVILLKIKSGRMSVLLGLLTLAAALAGVFLTGGLPGMRRYTPILASFYGLFIIVWKYANKLQLVKLVIFLLLIHHLIVYPINLYHLRDISPDRYPIWFNEAETPQKSLDRLLETLKKEDLKLICTDQSGQPFYCRLSEVYAALAGACLWNHLSCYQILGWDTQTNKLIPLGVGLWDQNYFEH